METALIFSDRKTRDKLKVIAAMEGRTMKAMLAEATEWLWHDQELGDWNPDLVHVNYSNEFRAAHRKVRGLVD